jgi:hypothetical protein
MVDHISKYTWHNQMMTCVKRKSSRSMSTHDLNKLSHFGRITSGVSPPRNVKILEVPKDEVLKSLSVVDLRHPLEVRNQLNKRKESCHKLEVEVVNLRNKVEKSNTQVKFLNNSMILDEILDSQRSPDDKIGLGYNKEVISNPKEPDAIPSFVKNEDRSDVSLSFIKRECKYDAGSSCSKNERKLEHLEDQIKEDILKLLIHLKVILEERHLHG